MGGNVEMVGIESLARHVPGRPDLADMGGSDAGLRQVLHGLPAVDQVGVQERVAALATRSIKKDAKLQALDLAVAMVDLTTLEGADTPGKVRAMCAKARQPDLTEPAAPPVAAVCVYGDLVPVAREAVAGSTVAVAAVATAFPSGRASLSVKLADVRDAVSAGADEIDMVIDRGAFLAGRYGQVYAEIVAVREACGDAHLKVIMETGELATPDNVARASWLAMMAGADFIKTSTGKEPTNATLPVSLIMVRAIREYAQQTGMAVGFKPAGGIRTAKQSIDWLAMMKEELGLSWTRAELFRFGASTLLGDIERQLEHYATGRYSAEYRHPIA
jgi:deoxyribose-phosphate aldolase